MTKPNPENCKNCPSKCAHHCAQLSYTAQHGAVLIIFPLSLQTSTTAQILSTGGEGAILTGQGTQTNRSIRNLSLVATKQSIENQVAEKHRPLTFNILKSLQLPRVVMQPLGILHRSYLLSIQYICCRVQHTFK